MKHYSGGHMEEPERLYQEAMEHYESAKDCLRMLERMHMEGAGRDSDLSVTDDGMHHTGEAVKRAEDLSISASQLFETLEHLYAVMQRIQEEQDTEIITDEDQHPGINNASTWL